MADMDQGIDRDSSIGQQLRSAREARGLTLDDVASQTRIPIRHLRAIEDSAWTELPAITYTVGFARSYANAVGLDGAEVGRQVREEAGGGQPVTQLSQEYYSPPDPARVPSRPLAWIAALLALLLVGGYLLWRSRLASDDQTAKAPPAAEQPADQPQQTAQAQPAPAPANLAGQPLTLVATGRVWVKLTDGTRQVRQATLEADGRLDVPADLQQPRVQTYNPQLLKAQVNGRDLGVLGTQPGTVTVDLSAPALTQRFAVPPAGPAPAATGGNGFQPQL